MQPQCDPAQERVVKQVPFPLQLPLEHDIMFSANNQGKPDWRLNKEHLEKKGKIAKKENEGSLLLLSDPLTVIGDIHMQFYDFLKIRDVGGNPENQQNVLLGDYVERGPFYIEVVILPYSLKLISLELAICLVGIMNVDNKRHF